MGHVLIWIFHSRDFARASLNYGLKRGLAGYLSTKNTNSESL